MGERLAFTFALTGRREWGHGTQGVALGSGLVGLSARAGPQTRLFRTISIYLIFLDFEHPTFSGDLLADSLREVVLFFCTFAVF